MDFGGRDQYVPDMSIDEDCTPLFNMKPLNLQDPPRVKPCPQPDPSYIYQKRAPKMHNQSPNIFYQKAKTTEHFLPSIKINDKDATSLVFFLILLFIVYVVLVMNAKIAEIQQFMYLMRQKNNP